jgi:general L-amino acid transport system substrate-binding protein
MRTVLSAIIAAVGVVAAAPAGAQTSPGAKSPTLAAIKARGHLECGVHTGVPGFSFPDDKGQWSGLDVDLCRSIAAAIFGDATKVKYTPTTVQQRWSVLASGQVDLLSRISTATFKRDTELGFNFPQINYYEGQTFIVRKSANVTEAKQLDGAAICVAAGSTEERNAGDWFRERNLQINIVKFEKNDDAIAAYDAGRCDTYTAGTGALAGQRRKLKNPAEHVILAGTISRDPQGPVTREGDDGWDNIVRWVFNGGLVAELHGVTAANVEKERADSKNAEVRILLGADGNSGALLGLSKDWMYNAIKQVGNYGEQFERGVGMGSDLKIERGHNALWTKGGLLYAPPIR